MPARAGNRRVCKKAKKDPYRLGNAKPGNIIAYGYLMRMKQI